ncbi:MAG: 30S ribosome-binding factor RbfA [Anaerolineae bacterium]|nr:30S ribosome-binding factor RbfA [Anaerolineae bacterium]
MPSRRQRRVAELIHRELSLLLMLDASDPRLADVTITSVDITPDLMLARVYFTVLGDDEKVSEAQIGLQRATGYLRTQLAGRVQLRFMPHLAFELDKSAAYGRRIDELLGELADGSSRPSPIAEEMDEGRAGPAEIPGWGLAAGDRNAVTRDERDNPIPDEEQERD